jgi:STE24 endopeptidase
MIQREYNFTFFNHKQFIHELMIKNVMILSIAIIFILSDYFFGYRNFLSNIMITGIISIFAFAFYSKKKQNLSNLDDLELERDFRLLAVKYGFAFSQIKVINSIHKTLEPNAFVYKKRNKIDILLTDSLLNQFEHAELLSIVAHEIGHIKAKDTKKYAYMLIFQIGLFAMLTYALSLNDIAYLEFGFIEPYAFFGLILVFIMYLFSLNLVNIIFNIFRRSYEYKADIYSRTITNHLHMISAFKKLTNIRLFEIDPHPMDIIFNYSHPPIKQRIDRLQKIKDENLKIGAK